jgi:hypothetical protein
VPTTPIVMPTTAHIAVLRIAASCLLVSSTLVSRCGDGKRAACAAHSGAARYGCSRGASATFKGIMGIAPFIRLDRG